MRNEVWGWDLSAIVHHDIDDELARDLVTRVRPSLEPFFYRRVRHSPVARSGTRRSIECDQSGVALVLCRNVSLVAFTPHPASHFLPSSDRNWAAIVKRENVRGTGSP